MLFGLTHLLMTPTYDTNDDPVMALVASGYGTVKGPDEHLLYSNVLLGSTLKQLYSVAPDVPWYGSYLLLSQFLAHWLLLYAILLLSRNKFSVLSYLIFYLGVGIYFLAHLQFTTTAFMVGLAGLSLVIVSLFQDQRGSHLPWLKWEGAACLIYASLIRYASLQMLCLASLPILIVIGWQMARSNKLKPYLLPATLAICGVLGGQYYDRQYYQQDEAWRVFLPYHSVTALLINYTQIPYVETTKPIFDEVGWSNTDYQMLREWVYLDQDTYSLERLQKFKEKTDALKLSEFPQVKKAWIHSARHAAVHPVFLICLYATIVFNRLNQRRSWQRSIIRWTLFWVVLIMIMLIVYLKLPSRVLTCLISLPFYFTLLLNQTGWNVTTDTQSPSRGVLFKIGVVILLLGCALLVWDQKKWSDHLVARNAGFKQNLTEMHQRWPEKVFVSMWMLPIESFLPYDNQSEIRDFKFLFLNGLQQSPHFQEKLRAYKIQSPMDELIDSDQMYLITREKQVPLIDSYLKQHYKGAIRLILKYRGEGFLVLQLTRKEKNSNSQEQNPPQTRAHAG
ncbi:hypothetical protein [Gimesia sp.]|uniref:hypothetical protein n=1 Tax=Gimesia sp. TaxID=2024833 RepID=UPI0032ECA59C